MHPDIDAEQAYFDHALEQREMARGQLGRSAELAADPKSAVELRNRLGSADVDPDEAVAFGRIDDDDGAFYIGKAAIWDQRDADDILVVNWKAPVAAPYYTASPGDAQGLMAKRSYRCRSNRILDIDDIVFAAVAEAVADSVGEAPALDDALLDSLAAARSGELSDIVTTIQAAQYGVISRDMRQLLVVQGAPGTGKTVVGLHRVSWLLYNMRDELAPNDVLIVGPNPAFVRYISTVLPSLGDEAVVQQPVTTLGPRVRSGRREGARVRRLKGDQRMADVLERALRSRQRIDTNSVSLNVGGRYVIIDGELVEARAAQLAHMPHNQVYAELRDYVIRLVEAELQRGGVRDMAALDISPRGAAGREIDNYLERAWPNLTPQAFLLELFSTRRRLDAAAAGLLHPDEIDLLAIPRETRLGAWEWSADDIALLDAADHLLNGTRRDYAYIVVDEAQDMSPMQLLSIARRSRTGWMTVLGDLAQGTSPWAQERWEDVARLLGRHGVGADLVHLELAYRLPAEVHEVAMRLLPVIGPDLATPRAVRSAGDGVSVRATRPDQLVDDVVATVRDMLGTGLIGIVVPDGMRTQVTRALDDDGLSWSPELRAMAAPIVVLGPEEAKGLEFDNVVVVEPAQIVAGHDRGLPALYVALTRCTQRLALVHAEPLPAELGLPSRSPAADAASAATVDGAGHDAGNGSGGHGGGADGRGLDVTGADSRGLDVTDVDGERGDGSDVDREIARWLATTEAALARGDDAAPIDPAAPTEPVLDPAAPSEPVLDAPVPTESVPAVPVPATPDAPVPVTASAPVGPDALAPGPTNGSHSGNGSAAQGSVEAPAVGAPPRNVELPSLVAAGEVEREVARAVAGALVRHLTLCVQPEMVPLVIEEMQRWVGVVQRPSPTDPAATS